MGRENGSNSTVSSIFEASGTGSSFAVPGNGIETRKESKHITKAWSIQFEDTTMDSQSETADEREDGDVTNLLHTKILLIAVLIVCFITLASVIAICGCMIRRYCKNREQHATISDHQPTALSKSTSMTGLNAAREHYFAQVEKNCQESSIITAHNTSDEVVSCRPNSDSTVHDLTGSSSTETELNSARLLQLHQQNIVFPVYGRKNGSLTSTPVDSISCCDNEGNVQCVDGAIVCTSSNHQNLTDNMVSSEGTCDKLTLVSNELKDTEENPGILEKETEELNSAAAPVVMRAPLTHSVSWFVSLNGDRTGSIRHSITENTYQELNVKDYENCPPDQRNCKHYNNVKGRKDLERHPLYELDENDIVHCQPRLVSSDMLNNVPACLGTDEKIPLIEKVRHPSTSEPTSALKCAVTQRTNLPTVVENQESFDVISSTSLSQSLSLPDDSNTWKQREERCNREICEGAMTSLKLENVGAALQEMKRYMVPSKFMLVWFFYQSMCLCLYTVQDGAVHVHVGYSSY